MVKKYLISNFAILAAITLTTSCANEDVFDSSKDYYTAQYEAKFIQKFGTPASDQTWGFGTTTRTLANPNPGDDYTATHEYKDANGNVIAGANMNHNLWGDQSSIHGGWKVPDPLTKEQKEVVTAYFQANPDLDYEDPEYRHFFVQQVYKGGTAQAGPSNENIVAANGSVYNSNNMNLLTVGVEHSHINDFNAGTCSTSNVLNHKGKTQEDQITLMVNVDDTSCFGYHETGSSTHHDNKAALVSWETIRTWANSHGLNGDCLDDGWNRSFLGFDLAIKEGAEAYDTNQDGSINYATYAQAPEAPQYAWDGEKVIQITTGEWESVTVGNEWSTWQETRPVYKDEYKTIMGCGWLTTNQNFYVSAESVELQQTISFNRAQLSSITEIQNCVVLKEVMDGSTWYQSVINLPKIKQLVDAGYLPVKDNSLTKWVKVGTSDGYFSDWIVTLTEAQRYSKPSVIRVMAEDLTIGDINADFDFNDVVFDVKWVDNGAQLTIRAAGGTLPLTIEGREVHQLFAEANPGKDINTDFSKGKLTMINTYAGRKNEYNCPVITLEGDFTDENGENNANLIKLYVNKGTNENPEWIEITAKPGRAAAKFGCDPKVNWCDEREDIVKRYPNFDEWVRGEASFFQ